MASRSLNKVTLIGNLTRDPELKYTPSGAAVCTIGLATNRSWVTAEGQTKEDTQFHRIVAWNKLAELCSKLLTKGKKVFMEGRLSYRSYVGKDGQQRSITEIILDDFIVFSNGRRMEDVDETSKLAAVPTPARASMSESEVTQDEETSEDTSQKKSGKKSAEKKEAVTESVDPDDIPF